MPANSTARQDCLSGLIHRRLQRAVLVARMLPRKSLPQGLFDAGARRSRAPARYFCAALRREPFGRKFPRTVCTHASCAVRHVCLPTPDPADSAAHPLTLPVWADPGHAGAARARALERPQPAKPCQPQAVENQMRSQSLQLIEQAHQQRMAALDANFAKLQQAIDGYYAQQDAERRATDAAQAEQRRLASRTALQRLTEEADAGNTESMRALAGGYETGTGVRATRPRLGALQPCRRRATTSRGPTSALACCLAKAPAATPHACGCWSRPAQNRQADALAYLGIAKADGLGGSPRDAKDCRRAVQAGCAGQRRARLPLGHCQRRWQRHPARPA